MEQLDYSIIIPYQHLEEREQIFYACLENLMSFYKGFEICIHETGDEPHLTVPPRCKYLFTEYSDVFHRAWAINRGVIELSTKKMLVLMDGDLIVDGAWINELLQCDYPSAGWGRINWLSEEGTEKYLKTKVIDSTEFNRTRTPSRGAAAGAITVVPRKVFLDICGIPEDFIGSWGGEDNAFWSKLVQMGYQFKSFDCEVTHLCSFFHVCKQVIHPSY